MRLLSTVYTNLRAGKNGTEDGIAYQAFHFGDGEGLTWEKEWASRLKDVLIHDVNVAFRTHRIVRFYEEHFGDSQAGPFAELDTFDGDPGCGRDPAGFTGTGF